MTPCPALTVPTGLIAERCLGRPPRRPLLCPGAIYAGSDGSAATVEQIMHRGRELGFVPRRPIRLAPLPDALRR